MKDMKRALRRHHVARLKKTRRWYHGRDLWADGRLIGMAVHTPQLCSCRGCGNQRRYFGPTIQELRYLGTRHDTVMTSDK